MTRRTPRKATAPPRKPRKFGWCMDGHHDECRSEYVDWNKVQQTCECTCHKRRRKS